MLSNVFLPTVNTYYSKSGMKEKSMGKTQALSKSVVISLMTNEDEKGSLKSFQF